MKVAIYTCITNNYDQLKGIKTPLEFDLFCFTDNLEQDSLGWNLVKIDSSEYSHKDIKCNIHKLLPDYDYYICRRFF